MIMLASLDERLPWMKGNVAMKKNGIKNNHKNK
jgi:hypothetical protein